MGNHEKYAGLKLDLHNSYLKDNGRYKKTVLKMKRIMAKFNYDGGNNAAPLVRKTAADTPGLAFTKTQTWLHPKCHICDKRHKGGYNKCKAPPTIIKAVDDLAVSGNFRKKDPKAATAATVMR